MPKAAYCIAATRQQAEKIVGQLKNSGFSNKNISVLFREEHTPMSPTYEEDNQAPEGAAAGAGAGAVLGGALGWLVGVSTLTVPGVGALIAAGPLVAALSGAAVGTALGGLVGGIVGLGIPEEEAKQYEGRIKAGNVLVVAHSGSSGEIDKARRIFENAGAQDISYTKAAGDKEGAARQIKAS